MLEPDFTNWPKLSEGESKPLYHCGMDPTDAKYLMNGGWSLVDVRLLPTNNDEERGEAVKAWLQGVRLGSITPSAQVAKYVDLEARIYGLTQAQGRARGDAGAREGTVDELTNFGK